MHVRNSRLLIRLIFNKSIALRLLPLKEYILYCFYKTISYRPVNKVRRCPNFNITIDQSDVTPASGNSQNLSLSCRLFFLKIAPIADASSDYQSKRTNSSFTR